MNRFLVASLVVSLGLSATPACKSDDGSNDGSGDTGTGDGDGDGDGDTDGTASGSATGDSSSGSATGDSSSGSATSDSSSGSATGDSSSGSGSGDSSSSSGDSTSGGDFNCVAEDPAMPEGDCADYGIVIEAPFDEWYTCHVLGPFPGVPGEWGGLTKHPSDDYKLLVGGFANTAQGALYSVDITRDDQCHVTGFEGPNGQVYSEAAYNDGGVDWGPNDVLFLARWPVNEFGQQELGSPVTDKIIDADPLGIAYSVAGLTFVPPGFAAEGELKIVSWPAGEWYSIAIEDDGNGLFNITDATYETTIQGGPEGFVYIDEANAGFDIDSILVTEWTDGNIVAWEDDGAGNPTPNTRVPFATGFEGAEGAFIDPLSGDFLFATFAGDEVMIAIRGFIAPQ